MIRNQKAAAGGRVLLVLQGQMDHHKATYYAIGKQHRGSLLFEKIDLPSVKFMTQPGNFGGQCEA